MILYTGGTFDLFHYGHMQFLRACKKLSETVVVSLNTDEFIEDYKGSPPILTYEQRKISIQVFDDTIKVVPNIGGYDSKPAIVSVNPDLIVVGDDWCKKDYYKQMNFSAEWLEKNGILLVYIPYTVDISASAIKSQMMEKLGYL